MKQSHYVSLCIKDDAAAPYIARHRQKGNVELVIHFNTESQMTSSEKTQYNLIDDERKTNQIGKYTNFKTKPYAIELENSNRQNNQVKTPPNHYN